MSRSAASLLLLLTGAVWGFGFVTQSTAMDAVGPWTFNALKFALAALVLLPLAVAESRRQRRPRARAIGGFLLAGTTLFLAASLQQIGIVSTSVTNAGFLTGLYVVLTPILALLLLRARVSPIVWPAAALALAGITLIGGGRIEGIGTGDAFVIGGALFWALHILAIGLFGRAGRPFLLSFVQFAAVALLCAPASLIEAPALPDLGRALPEILYGGLVATALAFTFQVVAQRHVSPPRAAILLSSEVLFAALFGAFLLGERIPATGLLGCAMIFTAMLAVEAAPLVRRERMTRDE